MIWKDRAVIANWGGLSDSKWPLFGHRKYIIWKSSVSIDSTHLALFIYIIQIYVKNLDLLFKTNFQLSLTFIQQSRCIFSQLKIVKYKYKYKYAFSLMLQPQPSIQAAFPDGGRCETIYSLLDIVHNQL